VAVSRASATSTPAVQPKPTSVTRSPAESVDVSIVADGTSGRSFARSMTATSGASRRAVTDEAAQ
jgi:hypothetical protein